MHRYLSGSRQRATLHELDLGYFFNHSLVSVHLPAALRALIFGMCYNQATDDVILPQQLERLVFQLGFTGCSCRTRTFLWPIGLRHLHAGGLLQHDCDVAILPDALTYLHLGGLFNWPLQSGRLPMHLLHLNAGYSLISRCAMYIGR